MKKLISLLVVLILQASLSLKLNPRRQSPVFISCLHCSVSQSLETCFSQPFSFVSLLLHFIWSIQVWSHYCCTKNMRTLPIIWCKHHYFLHSENVRVRHNVESLAWFCVWTPKRRPWKNKSFFQEIYYFCLIFFWLKCWHHAACYVLELWPCHLIFPDV